MPFTIRARQTQTFKIPAGSASAPSLTFSNASSSGLFHSGGQGNVGVSVNGVERLTIHANGISVNGTVTANSLVINNASTVQYAPFSLANVQITDSAFAVLDDTAVSTDGGFIVINGNGFWGGTVVTVDSTPAIASSVLSYTKIGAQVPAKSAGTYAVSVVRPDALSVTLPTGLSYSPFPVWSTSSTLANVDKYTAFTQTLAATEASSSNITYTVANGSSLPANVTLSSGGVLSGNITTDGGNTTTYSFSIQATDTQFQNIPRIFGLTALNTVITATGGTITTSGSYKILTFTASGTLTVTSGGVADILVVGGGGGGGYGAGGGGGAGGVLQYSSVYISTATYTVTVGTGGNQNNGTSSQISGLTSVAYGGARGNSAGIVNTGGPFGSGGGGSVTGAGTTAGTNGTSGQGGNGGAGLGNGGNFSLGGGGGGSSSNGGDYVVSTRGGNGGAGISTDISGTMVVYAGGGGGGAGSGGSMTGGTGGSGGGGNGGRGAANGGAATGYGSGGGGGGAVENQPYDANVGGNGTNGIVIIRYRN